MVGRSADAVLQFQWRASAAGAEKLHSRMVPRAGTRTKQWRQVVAVEAELHHLAPLAGTSVDADVALLADWESCWAWNSSRTLPSCASARCSSIPAAPSSAPRCCCRWPADRSPANRWPPAHDHGQI